MLDEFPHLTSPTKIAAHSSSTNNHVQCTNTLYIAAASNSNRPSIVDRFCTIVTSHSQITPGESVHQSAESDRLFLRINWCLVDCGETGEDEYLARVQWHIVPIETHRACLHLREVSQTNIFIWVSPC